MIAAISCVVAFAPSRQHSLPYRGVNYQRFIPEHWLGLSGYSSLYANVSSGGACKPQPCKLSLCDVAQAAPNAGERMLAFLNESIQEVHFRQMSDAGFNLIRLPLGYWNLYRPTGGPNAPAFYSERWLALQQMLAPEEYEPYIERVFSFAQAHGLKVLLDLHGAPGGQTANQNTGCATGCEGKGCNQAARFFDTPFNYATAVRAVERMAQLCEAHAAACFGIELLNEPADFFPLGTANLDRKALLGYYQDAVRAARGPAGGLSARTPIVVEDSVWWLESFWATHATQLLNCTPDAGTIVFESHIYDPKPTSSLLELEALLLPQLEMLRRFCEGGHGGGHACFVGEWGLSNTKAPLQVETVASWWYEQAAKMPASFLGLSIWNFDGPGAWGGVVPNGGGVRSWWSSLNNSSSL
tara:strand:- start:207 stop:1442 length:1236 start_codon:yes stop_codon:yes gene_type:complete